MATTRLSIDYMVEFRTAFHGSLNRRRADGRRMPNLTRARQARNQHKKLRLQVVRRRSHQ
ncbi:protein of unknown function [Methylocella tundrae]|uniref:Uncharacterized protein n=1 Tax=Methylocella tundrae TaxID=227605 RepID=A0A4V6INB7_METTU|nr:protein of unknown function [Methylocella tundrae]